MKGLADSSNILSVDSTDRNPSHFQHVNVLLFPEPHNLLWLDVSIGKHSLLFNDIGPVLAGIHFLDLLIERLSHLNNPLTHGHDILVPLGPHFGRRENSLDDVRSKSRIGRVNPSYSLTEEIIHELDPFLILIGNGHAADSLSIETKVFGKRLNNRHSLSILSKQLNSIGVLLKIPRHESLVGHIKDAKKLLLLGDLENLIPLLLRGIESSGIMSDWVENHNRVFWHISKRLEHQVEGELPSSSIIVLVVLGNKSL